MDYENAINEAVASAAALPSGTEFVLKDLFRGTAWSAFDKGSRLNLGRLFKNRVTSSPSLHISPIGKAANNSTLYRIDR